MSNDDKDLSPLSPNSDARHDEQNEEQPDKGRGIDAVLPAEIEELLDQLPEEAQQKIVRLVSLTTAYSHHGPLPSPADFGEYDRIRPGSADDIMQMAKNEQDIKKAILSGRIFNERLTIAVAMVGVICLVAVSFAAIWQGQPVVASITALASAALLAIRAIPRRKD